MNELQIFTNSEFGKLGVIEIDGKPYFPARKCAEKLGHTNPERAIREFCKGVTETVTPTTGGEQTIKVITEGDLYRLIVHSKLPSAERFEKWIFDEVIPSIRKHNGYLTPSKIEEVLLNPDTIIRLATDLKIERETRERLERQTTEQAAKIESDAPKVLFADAVTCSDDTILIRELAKILKGNGVDIGEKRLFERLRNEGFLIRREGADYNTPSQYAMERGLFKVKETTIAQPDGRVTVKQTPRVTGKGQTYFVNYFLKKEVISA